MIKTIIFDLGEVLINIYGGLEKRLAKISKLNKEEVSRRLRNQKLEQFLKGRIAEDDYLQSVIDQGLPIKLDYLKKIIRDNFFEIEGTRRIVEKLKGKGFKLGLLSLNGKEWVDYVEDKFHLNHYFAVRLYSFNGGIDKTNEKAYKIMLEKLGSSAEETLFIDDYPENLSAAEKLGIKTIRFGGAKRLEDNLIRLGVL